MVNFWDVHGILFLIFISFFPRLTLLFSSVTTGGVLWWLGFIFAPRILVAVLATMSYLNTNPILVFISWVVALSGEFGEKHFVKRGVHIRTVRRPRSPANHREIIDIEPS